MSNDATHVLEPPARGIEGQARRVFNHTKARVSGVCHQRIHRQGCRALFR